MRKVLLVVGLLLLAACALPKPPADVDAVAKDAYAKLDAGDLAGLKAMSNSETRAQETQELIDQMRAMIPREKYTKDQTTSWQVSVNAGSPSQATVRRIYSYPSGDVLFDVALEKPANAQAWTLVGIHINKAPAGASTANAFTLEGKSPLHFATLAAAILSPLICIFAFIRVVSAPKFGWKWAFAVLSLLAFGQFALNWTTGQWSVQPLNLSLLGAGFFKGFDPTSPLILTVGLPIGAVIGLWRSGKARRDKKAAEAASFQ